MIRATCEVKNAKFINNDLNFTYRDGSCDEAAFVKDGIHLSTHGLHKLLSNISLSERQQSPTARPGKNRPPNRQGSPPKRTTRDTRGNGPHANGSTASAARRTESRNHTAEPAWHTVGQCRKWGETNHVTKKCRHDVAVTCFTCGKLRDLWKTATVVPVPKKHPPGSLENDIRPISLTPILAKAFEGIVLNWVDDVITPQIDERQFGGLAGTGTTDALVEMFHSWCEATDKPDSFVRVLLVDYSKAFDHINHELLITKLCDMGLPPHLVRWMAAFLIDRQQSVKIGDTVSNIGYPNGGVPQGTLSGPKNFLVQINDLQTPCPIFKYVDDSTVFDVCNNTSVPMLQESADVITDWSRRNDMRINARKTKEMIICFCRNDNHVASIPRIVVDDNDIERVTQARVLGVTLSSDLSWNAHVDTIVSKARKRVFTIYQLKRAGIRQCDLLRVYVSVIRPVLEYACPVWHTSLPMYLSDHIETIQKRCLRTIFPGYSYDEARSISNLPTLFERRTKLCQSYFRKMQNADHKLHKLLPKQCSIPYGLRTYNTLPVPLARTDRFRRSLIPWGLANWQHNVL